MTLLLRTEADYWGGAEIVAGEPSLEVATDLYALPYRRGGRWGVFTRDGAVVESTVTRMMPEGRASNQEPLSDRAWADVAETLPDGDYLYGGAVEGHFGHFLIETLARLWPLADGGLPPGCKLVMHGDGSPAVWFERPYVREIFAALGVAPERIVHVDRPLRIGRMSMPAVGIRLQAFAHPAYARLCHVIGARLVPTPAAIDDRPAYLAKTRLSGGVSGVTQEEPLIETLAAAGVDIIHPQELSFTDQIALFAGRRVIAGTASSAQHVSLFTPRAARLEFLVAGGVNANAVLIDRLNGNRARYWRCETLRQEPHPRPGFMTDWRFDEPARVARALLRLLDADAGGRSPTAIA